MVQSVTAFFSDPSVQNALLSLVGTIIVGVATYALRPRSSVAWAEQFSVTHFANDGNSHPFQVHSTTLWLKNRGRAVAQGVELILNFAPQHFQIWPVVPYEMENNPDGRFILRFGHLASGENVAINLLAVNAENPIPVNVRWNDGIAKQLLMQPQVKISNLLSVLILILLLIGIYSTIYFAIWLMIF